MKLAHIRRLTVGDAVRLTVASVVLVACHVGFTVSDFVPVRKRLRWVVSRLARVVPGTPSPHRIVWAVERADARLPGGRTCLMRSLTAEALLRLYSYDPVHRIGVNPNGPDGFIAHSWLEWRDDILIGDLDDLSTFDVLPPLDDYDGEIP